jgi:TRAP-type mannitol/chloroaromatic compound transport system permease small subunit
VPDTVSNIIKFLDRICLWAAYCAAGLLCLLVLLGISEIVVRNFFNTSISFSVEYSGYMVAAILLLGSGQALKDGAHVRVTLLEEYMSGNIRAALTLAAMLLALLIAGYWVFAALRFALDTYNAGTVSYFTSQTPLWVPQLILALGPVVLLCGLLAKFLRLLWSADEGEALS